MKKERILKEYRWGGKIVVIIFFVMMVWITPTMEGLSINIENELKVNPLQNEPNPFKDKIFLKMEAGKVQVVTNEIVPLTIKLLSHGMTIKDIQYPGLSHENISIAGFGNPVQKSETINGILYEVMEFKTEIFAKKEGDFKLGPARLECILLIEKGKMIPSPRDEKTAVETYFGALESHSLSLESDEVSLRVIPLPEKKRPVDFSGAVGNFNFTLKAHPQEVRLGEPITLRMTIGGKGNFDAVIPPRIEKGMDFKAYDPQVNQREGIKIYEQVLIPQSEAVREIPGIRFSFYDPGKKEYRTLYREPIPIKVLKPDVQEARQVSSASGLEIRDIIDIKAFPGRLKKKGDFLYKKRGIYLSPFFPPLLFGLILCIHKRREKLKTDLRYALRLKAKKSGKNGIEESDRILKRGNPIEFYDSLFKTLQEYLGNRFNLPSKGMTGNVVSEVLKSKGLDEEVLKKIKNLFIECDQARYGRFRFEKTEMEKTLTAFKEVFHSLDRERRW